MITLAHDLQLDIATGRSRKETNWKTKETSWQWLINRLSETHRTAETYAEYIASKKPRQDEIKDIGGFVGGHLSGGRRKAGAVLHRQLITLDLDFAKPEFWKSFTLLYDNAAAIYSTHKHSKETPRYRLVVPLDRPVRPDEYEAIARRIAGDIGIELFDPTTFQPERLMYWPSTSKDGEFVFDYQDGEPMVADEVLARYHDWTDTSQWPVSERVDKILQRNIQKQGDPLEKPGVVGAWCRCYSISEVIDTYLSEVYEACADGRYTYKEGSTAGGLVVYDDKYAYSHHGTDPTSGKLCNAFDLVRVHNFGLKDEDSKADTPSNKLPSYSAMLEFAISDSRVVTQVGTERIAGAMTDFADSTDEDEEPDMTWLSLLEINKQGEYLNTIANVAIILENDPNLKGCFATDEFRRKKLVRRNLPWRKVTHDTVYVKDEDEQNLTKYLEKVYGISSRLNIKDAFDTHIDAQGFHPVRDYLNSIKWDGVERVDSLIIDYLGAADNEYVRAVTRKTLAAAVGRILRPGIKFDYVLTFIGTEGQGKSSLIARLGGEWFSDSFSFHMLHSKEAYEQIHGFWLIEIAELAGLKKADVESAKQFISKQEDSFRRAYGRNVVTYKRQCIFFGSTNNRDFLISQTGNRRFWPIDTMVNTPTRSIFSDLTPGEVAQIWAEAVEIYKAGEPLYLSAELEEFAKTVQQEHLEVDERQGIIHRYLDTLLPEDWEDKDVYERRQWLRGDEIQAEGTVVRDRVCAAEIWCEALGGNEKDMSRQVTKDIHNMMRQIDGWEQSKTKAKFKKYGVQLCYIRVKKLDKKQPKKAGRKPVLFDTSRLLN